MMQPVPSIQRAVIHRAAILQRAARPPAPVARPAVSARPRRPQQMPWDVLLLFVAMGVSLAFVLVHLAR